VDIPRTAISSPAAHIGYPDPGVLKTLDRYVIREILPPLFLSLLIFTFVLDIPPLMEQLEALIAKGVSWGIAAKMLAMLIPQALGLTIPMSLLVGILIALGRMSGDREAVALLACGVSPYRLLRPVMGLGIVAAAVHLYVMLWAIPDANQAFRELTYEVVSQKVEDDVRPQVFFDDFPGWVLYMRDLPKTGGGWKDVMVADTSKPETTVLYLANRGRLILNREKQTVDLVLEDGTRYSSRGADGKQIETYRFPQQLIVKLDPQTVFQKFALMRGINEMTIPELRAQILEKETHNIPAHAERIAIQQKFSFPAACLVFGIIAVALGLTVAREGKVGAFVVGIGVIFAYYALLYLAEALTKGYYAGSAGALRTPVVAIAARWVPNLVLLPFGVLALIWRARWAEGRIPFRSAVRLANAANAWIDRRRQTAESASSAGPAGAGAARARVVLVVRIPRLSWMMPNILDRYIARIYLRVAALSFAALLGIFYISTFIDRSEKLFKGQATTATMMRLLAFMTPQFVYYVVPLAALLSVLVTFGVLSRTSELSVMKACGISLYRISAPLLLLGVVWSGILYGLEQQIMARANQRADALDSQIRGRPPRTVSPLNRRWLVGHDGAVYHYSYFDQERKTIQNLVVYRPARDAWELESQLFAPRAVFSAGRWIGTNGWQEDFAAARNRWTPFQQRALVLEPPDYFETEQPMADLMTVPELKRFIDEQAASGFNVVPQMIELQKKLAFPFVTVVMTLLAIPFGMTTGKRGTLYGIGIGIVLALGYWMVGGAFAAVGKAGLLDPIMAGWAPNILAAGGAAYLLLTART
jgi:LPS export ABC transporter permease LptG/LPS export ABC transporter permease LptF